MADPRGPLYEGRPQQLLSPYELAQSYRRVNPGLYDDLDDYELVSAIKRVDPDSYKLIDPLLEGSELLLRAPVAKPPLPPPLLPKYARRAGVDVSETPALPGEAYPLPTPQMPLTTGGTIATTAIRTVPTMIGSYVGGALGGGAGLLGGPAAPVTSPTGAVLGASGGGAIGAGIGATGAQWYEKAFGPREEYSIPGILAESALGAFPNPAMRAATFPGRLATSAAVGAGFGAVGGPVQTLVEEGRFRLPSAAEIATGAVFGAATHATIEGVGAARGAVRDALSFADDLTGHIPAHEPPPPFQAPLTVPMPSDWPGTPQQWQQALDMTNFVRTNRGATPQDLAPMQQAVKAQYEAEEAALAGRLQETFGPEARRPDGAPDHHTAVTAKTYLEEIAGARMLGELVDTLPTRYNMLTGAPATDLATGQIQPQTGPFAHPSQKLLTETSSAIPEPTTEIYQPSPVTSIADQLQLNLNAPPGPPRLIPRPLELTPPPVPRETPQARQGDMLTGRPRFNQPIEQTGEMGGREATLEQPRIPGVSTPGYDRPYATGPNAGPRRKGEAHGTPRPIRRQVRTGKKVSYETVQTTRPAEDPGTYPPEVRRELATIAWELEKHPRTKVQGGTSMAAAEHLVTTNQAQDIQEAIGILRQRGATAGGWLPGAPVYNEIIQAAEGAHAHVTREEMLRQIREALLEGKGNALTDAAAQVARGRLQQRARTAAGEELPLVRKPGQPELLGAPPKMQRGEHALLSQGHEGDELIGWVDEAGHKTLPSQDVDEFVRTARDASDSEIMAAVRWQQAGEPIKEGTEGFFEAAKNEAIRRGLIRYRQPGLEMGGPGGDKGPSLFDFEGGPPEKPTTPKERTGWEDFEKTVTDEERLAVHENARDVQAKEEAYREVMGIPPDQPLTLAQKVEAATGTFVEKVPPGFVEEPPPPPTALSELTARRKARALENAAQQEELPPPPSTTPEQAARNEAVRKEIEREQGFSGELPPPIPMHAQLPHELAGMPGLEPQVGERQPVAGERQPVLPGTEGVREQNISTPEVAEAPFSLTPPPAKPAKGKAPAPGLFDRFFGEGSEKGILVFDIPPNDRTGLRKFLKDNEKEHGGETWFARAETALDNGDYDRAWKVMAAASLRSQAAAEAAARTPQEEAALRAAVRGTPLQDTLPTQIVAGARQRAGIGEEPKGTGYPPTRRVTQAGAARGRARVGPAGIINPGARQRPLSSIAPETRAATLDKLVTKMLIEGLETPEGMATIPGNTDTFLRLFRQVGEIIYKGENLKLLREAGIKVAPEELAQHFNATISDAGRTLQMLSAFAQAHQKILNEAAGRQDLGAALGGTLGGPPPPYVGYRSRRLSQAGERATQEVVDEVAARTNNYHAASLARDMQKRRSTGPFRALNDASYAWMLSKWNTAVRNYTSFVGRYGVDSLDHALTIPIARLMGDESTLALSKAMLKERGFFAPGRRGTAVTPWSESRGAWSDDLQHIFDFTTDSLNMLHPDDARRAIRLLLDVPEEAAHFLGSDTGEELVRTSDFGNVPVMRHLINPKVQRVLTMFNRAQEFSARATVFDATTRALLRAKGLDPTSTLLRPTPEIIEAVGGKQAFDDLIGTATAQAMEATFAGRTSRDSLPGALIRFFNDWAVFKLGVPFPRFNISAAPRWIYDHSPAALLDLIRFPLDRVGITAPRGTLAGGRLYRGVRAQEIQRVDLPVVQEKITVAERRQGEAMQELIATQREWNVRQRQIARLERRAQDNLPGTMDALGEARRIQEQLGRRREALKEQFTESRSVVKDLQSQRKHLLDHVADATAINAPNYAQFLARMATGTVGGLGAAWVVRSQDGAKGTRWYEYRIDRGEGKDPIIMDFRPFAPFAQYLFVADVLKDFYDNTDWGKVRTETSNLPEGTPDWLEHAATAVTEPVDWTSSVWNNYQGKYTEAELGSQFAQAFLSISRAAGTTLTLTDLMTQNGWPSLEEAGRAIVGTIGQFFSRFTVPGQQVSDILTAPFSEEEAKIRTPPKATLEEWTHPLAAPFANIPFVKQLIPERISQTTGQPVATEYPLLRGLLGIGTAPRDFVVEEARRVGLPGQSVFIRETGDYGLDRTIAENYASILKQELPAVFQSEQYRQLGSPALQRDFLQRAIFPALKRVALAEARTTVGESRFEEATVRGEEARRRDRQNQLLDSLEGELGPEEPEMEPPPGPPLTAPPPPPF